MDTTPASSRFIRLFAVGFVVLCLAVGAFNALVDPYCIFGSPRYSGINALKPQAADRVRVAKPYMAEAFKAHTVIGGNSRPEMGLDPASPCWKQEHQPVFNMGIPGANFRLQTEYVRHAVVATGASRVVLGLDFVDFLADIRSTRDRIDWDRPLLGDGLRLTQHSGVSTPVRTSLQRMQDRFNALLSLETLIDSFITIGGQRTADASTRRNDGFNPAQDYLPIIRAEGQSVLFQQKNRELAETLGRPGLGLYNVGKYSSEPLQALDRFLRWAAEHQVEVVLFMNPYHADYLTLIRTAGHSTLFERWRNDILGIARAHGTTLWDFNASNAFTNESPPPPRNRHDVLHWFWEPAHYRKELGDLMVAQMEAEHCLGEAHEALPGVHLTNKKVTRASEYLSPETLAPLSE